MAERTWHSALSVGVPSMDGAHQGQASLVDAIEGAVSRGDAREAQDLLLRLVEETSDHFAAEHELMQATAFPGREAHIEEHNRLLDHVSTLLARVTADKVELTAASVRSLRVWFVRHVQEADRALGSHVRGAILS
jgi:hemerythrin